MLKLSHTTRNTALAALLATGLAGSAAVTLAPVAAHAQYYHDYDDRARAGYDRDYYRDRDYRYRGDVDDRYRGDHRYWNGRTWVGIGVPGFGIGFYDQPNYNGYYGPYCSSYDAYYGYCSY